MRRIIGFLFLIFLFFSFNKVYSEDYKIGPEDVLGIFVWGNEKLSMDLLVRPDGKISYPLIGDIKVSGLTPSQLSNLLKKKLSDR